MGSLYDGKIKKENISENKLKDMLINRDGSFIIYAYDNEAYMLSANNVNKVILDNLIKVKYATCCRIW